VVSNKWGFTPLTREEFARFSAQGRVIDQGSHVKIKSTHGALDKYSILVDRVKGKDFIDAALADEKSPVLKAATGKAIQV